MMMMVVVVVIVVMVMMVMMVMVTVRICEDEEEDDDDYYDDDEEEEPLFMDMYRKHAAPKNEPRTQTRTLVRACSVEMHFNILQHFARATLFGHLQEKSRAPEPRPTLSASLRSRNACQEFGYFIRKLTGKMPRPKAAARTLCEPTQPKLTSTCHKSRLIRKFTGKMPRPRLSPERGHTFRIFRASLRSRNVNQHFTRATLYGNLQEKCRGPAGAPWSSTGLYFYS